MQEVSRRWVRKAMTERLTKVLSGKESKPERPPDTATLDALRGHARAVTPQWAVR